MLSLVVRPLRGAVWVITANDSSRQIAAGVALGMMLGLVPKGNLIALALGVLLCALRVNKTAGVMAAAAFSAVSVALDTFTHRLGAHLLKVESLQGFYAWLYDQPLGPWIGFNNTVVLGSLVLGVYLAYPCYVAAESLLARIQAPIAAWIKRFKLARWLLGVDVSSRLGINPTLGGGS
ncbi:MAG: TIGR03546 family protein [Planctomycetota bacterium]